MKTLLDTVLDTIRTRREGIERRFGVRLIGVVGSVARGEERPDSDVDVAYRVSGSPTLFDLANVQFELEQAIGRSVDLVDPTMVRPEARDWMEEDLVLA